MNLNIIHIVPSDQINFKEKKITPEMLNFNENTDLIVFNN